MKIYHAGKLRQTLHRMSRTSMLTAASILTLGLSSFGITGIAHAGAPAQICNVAATECMNRKQGCTSTGGSCQIISYTNDDDYNETFRFKTVNLCSGSYLVTQTCPFTNGSGMDTDNAGDWIGQLTAYNSSGVSIGCLGDDQSGNAVMLGCNGSNGTGGGVGTVWIAGGSSGMIGSHWIPTSDFGNRYESNKFYGLGLSYPEVLDNPVNGSQLRTDGANGAYRWVSYGF